ncbi:LytR C-terminal domain-containing protein [Streptomyces boncukensis]|uniref:LytR family transcriptional regulator n=1 Tax=Streptomyces boncukensis TaxID=2711219 RepID=A0A6G4WS29_9ACTN|nr:LytR family transcriptional regulator [Streptomyces boncukensis]
MTDGYGYDPYGQGGQQPELVGYDEYGRPVYRQQDPAAYPGQDGYAAPYDASYDPYAQQQGYDPYASYAAPQQPEQPSAPYPGQGQDPQGYGYDPYAQQAQTRTQAGQGEWFPQQPQAPQQERHAPRVPPQASAPESGPAAEGAPSDGREYHTAQFSFVEEPDEDSEDVIDWLKFTESRTERREEAKRRGRHRVVALVVALVLVAAGGVGYLWYAGMLPGLDGPKDDKKAATGERRDVIVVHLRTTDGKGTSTALLVDNASAAEGTSVLLPNTLAVSGEDGKATTLGKAVEDEGAGPTREALGTLLGADIKGTWRLDTPFLENLVELVGGIAVDADATVPGGKKGAEPLVRSGKERELDGKAAVGYATYRGTGEPQTKQLARFGQVMQAALRKLSTTPDAATKTVRSLGQIPDPSLSEGQLGASLAKLAEHAKKGAYHTRLLPVRPNGTLSERTSDTVVKKILGGAVKNTDPDAAPRVNVKNGSGRKGAADAASVALVNGGYQVVKGGAADSAQAKTLVTYAEPEQKAKAEEVAKTLGVDTSVRRADGAANADVSVVLGRDYEG